MCHCVLDDDDDLRVYDVPKLKTLAEGLAASLTFVDSPILSEKIAEIMAIELLFPLEFRLKHLDEYRNKTISDYSLALRYRIPVEFAEIAMFDTYIEKVSKRFRNKFIAI